MASPLLRAQELELFDFRGLGDDRYQVDHRSNTTAYYVLFAGDTPDRIVTPVRLSLGRIGIGAFNFSGPTDVRRKFYEVRQISVSQPLDLDSDGMDDLYELRNGLDGLDASDAALDPDGNGLTHLEEALRVRAGSNKVGSSPGDGETGVAVTRETIIHFTSPLAVGTSPDDADFLATHGATPLAKRLQLSADRKKVTLFYANPLPSSSRIRVTVRGDALTDVFGEKVDGDGDDHPGGDAIIEFATLSLSAAANTGVCGRVFASELVMAAGGQMSVNQPLEGARITVDGREDELLAVTDALGNFKLQPAPVGRFFVHIDGRSASADIPSGAYYPFVGKTWTAVAGEVTNVGDIYLPLIPADSLREVSATENVSLLLPPSTLAEFPDFAAFRLTVPAGSLFRDDGSPGEMAGVQIVPPDRLPGTLPANLDFPFVFTVQTDGAANFDIPAPVLLPNVPHPVTGVTRPPGSKTALWSFNHDSGKWQVVGPMTVSAGGETISTDLGVGVLAPGWHGQNPATRVRGGPLLSEPAGTRAKDVLIHGGASILRPGTVTTSPAPAAEVPEGPIPVVRVSEAPFVELRTTSPRSSEGDPAGTGGHGPGGPSILREPAASNSNPAVQAPENPCPEPDSLATNPIFLFSGEKLEQATDLRIAGRGFDFVWARTYRSRLGMTTPQGFGWDHGYNIYLQMEGPDRRLFNGNNRSDLYQRRPDATWVAREFFRTLEQRADGAYRLTFADTSRWEFHHLDGSTRAGKISAIVDRNGNTMSFTYDIFGRLITINDTLGRDITLSYDPQGWIAAVTDFTGRRVTYQYYGQDEPGGPFGALRSATSPPVIDTPNGNDFPVGKTWTYTYSQGFDLPELNNNLLTKTDPKGQTIVVNTYAATTDPTDLIFDRVVRQQWGDLGDLIDLVYVELGPNASNQFARLKVILNDRVGNVRETFYDASNRRVLLRRFTGRADPDQPTTAVSNRPVTPLRATDPPFFESRWSYNADSQITRHVAPNGNVREYLYECDFTLDPPPNARGNLREIRSSPGTHVPAGDQALIVEEFEHDPRFNGCCGGQSFVSRHVDARGHETLFEYDSRGNRTRMTERIPSVVTDWEYNAHGQVTVHTLPDNGNGHRRRDVFTYYENGFQKGYLQSVTLDAGGEGLTSTFGYNEVGRAIERTDPKGNTSRVTLNALDQPVRLITRDVDGNGLRYERDLFYDANDNVVRLDIQNRNETGVLQPNTHFTHTFAFDSLNHLVAETREVDADHAIVTEYAYDGNRNRTQIRFGEAVNGNQPNNTVRMDYDERDLVLQTVLAPGDPAQSTTRRDYDGNGNLVTVVQGLEGQARTTQNRFDGYERLVQTTDPMGNETLFEYDPNGNLVRELVRGELHDVPGNFNNLRLAERSRIFDALDRPVQDVTEHFDPVTQLPVGDGQSVLTRRWSDHSQLLTLTNDNAHATVFSYDSVNRLAQRIDAKGNVVTRQYDANSNLTATTESELSDLGNLAETFVTTFAYDGLDRLTRTVDNLGNTRDYAYDSRSNRTLFMDARRPLPGDPGNITRFRFDGLNRLTETVRFLTADGTGTGAPAGTITGAQVWDDTSRLIARVDDNGHATEYHHDALNRRVGGAYADGTSWSASLNPHHRRVQTTDPNGSTCAYTYDADDRLVGKQIVPGPGVSADTTFEIFQYDGLGRLILAQDDDSTVTFAYDSLSHRTEETLNGLATRCTYDGIGNMLTCTYPGGRVVSATYDELERLKSVADGAGFGATYHFIGPGRVERLDYANGTSCTSVFDDLRRPVERHTRLDDGGAPVSVDHWTFGWDQESNKTARHNELPGGLEHAYSYDSLQRLVSSVNGGLAVGYELDGVHNRLQVTGGPDAGIYVLDPTSPVPADAQVNQYTQTPFDSRGYDEAGNLVRIEDGTGGVRMLVYDYKNRLVSHDDGSVQSHYAYDALGRRIEKNVGGGVTRFFYRDWQVCEERDGGSATAATYVYGHSVDEPLNMQRGGTDYFYHRDDNYNVTAVTGATGELVERYDYEDYGDPLIADASGQPIDFSQASNPYLFTGRRYDDETAYLFYRTRFLDPKSGCFISRDALGVWGDLKNLGDANSYVASRPFHWLDPDGRKGRKFEDVSYQAKEDVSNIFLYISGICPSRTVDIEAQKNEKKLGRAEVAFDELVPLDSESADEVLPPTALELSVKFAEGLEGVDLLLTSPLFPEETQRPVRTAVEEAAFFVDKLVQSTTSISGYIVDSPSTIQQEPTAYTGYLPGIGGSIGYYPTVNTEDLGGVYDFEAIEAELNQHIKRHSFGGPGGIPLIIQELPNGYRSIQTFQSNLSAPSSTKTHRHWPGFSIYR